MLDGVGIRSWIGDGYFSGYLFDRLSSSEAPPIYTDIVETVLFLCVHTNTCVFGH